MSVTDKLVTLERLESFGKRMLTGIKDRFIAVSEKANLVTGISMGENAGEIILTKADETTSDPIALDGVVTSPTYDETEKTLTLPVVGSEESIVVPIGGLSEDSITVASQEEVNQAVDDIFAEVFGDSSAEEPENNG